MDDGKTLLEMVRHVGSGDADNVEARAARYYWGRFFSDFRREDETDRRNALLNYGYAVVRSGLARALVAHGLIPAFGVHHASVTNAFNLADDLLEPFRPYVDVLARTVAGEDRRVSAELSVDDRRAMAGALFQTTAINGETVTLLVATEQAAASLLRVIKGESAQLLQLPALGEA
jgi:CRISPR-associated protein Cas1